jgi:hypothetical protein
LRSSKDESGGNSRRHIADPEISEKPKTSFCNPDAVQATDADMLLLLKEASQ